MARSEYIYVAEAWPRAGTRTAHTVKRELKAWIEADQSGHVFEVLVFRGGKLIKVIWPRDLAEWLDS